MRNLIFPIAALALFASPVIDGAATGRLLAQQQDKQSTEQQIVVRTIVEGLNNPFSLTIEKETNRVYVAESGAGRIVEIKDGQAVELADDFPVTEFRGYAAGPLSVFSAGESVLLVGHDSDAEKGSITRLKEKLRDEDADAAEPEFDRQTVTIDNSPGPKLRQLSNLLLKHGTVYAVTHGDKKNGWLAVADIRAEEVTSLSPSIATTRDTERTEPSCVTVSPSGAYLLVSQMGQRGPANDSRLVFYTLQGKLLSHFDVELNDIVALAYSPNRKHLFAIDYSFADPDKGALYKLIGNGSDGCTTRKLADISYVTSMAFDASGALWLTSLGGPPSTDGKLNGKVIKIEGLDEPSDNAEQPQ